MRRIEKLTKERALGLKEEYYEKYPKRRSGFWNCDVLKYIYMKLGFVGDPWVIKHHGEDWVLLAGKAA